MDMYLKETRMNLCCICVVKYNLLVSVLLSFLLCIPLQLCKHFFLFLDITFYIKRGNLNKGLFLFSKRITSQGSRNGPCQLLISLNLTLRDEAISLVSGNCPVFEFFAVEHGQVLVDFLGALVELLFCFLKHTLYSLHDLGLSR